MKLFFFFGCLLAFVFIGAGCDKEGLLKDSSGTEADTASTTESGDGDALAQDTMFSNPATLYCLQKGGEFKMRKTLNGTTEGFCVLPDLIQCEVWAYYRGECPESGSEVKEEDDAGHETRIGEELKEEEGTEAQKETKETDTVTAEGEENMEAKQSADLKEEESDDAQSEAADSGSEAAATAGAIDISLEPGEEKGEVVMLWDIGEQEAPDGFFVMVSSKEDLTYPTPFSHAVESSYSRKFTWTDLPSEKTYYFRVCIAQEDRCGQYSSVVSITIP